MVRELSAIKLETFFSARQHCRNKKASMETEKRQCNTDLRQHFFSERVVNIWNSLDKDTVAATSINCFIGHLHKMRNKDESAFDFSDQSTVVAEPVPLGGPHSVSYPVTYKPRRPSWWAVSRTICPVCCIKWWRCQWRRALAITIPYHPYLLGHITDFTLTVLRI